MVSLVISGCNKPNSSANNSPNGFQAPQADRIALLEQEIGTLQQRVASLEWDNMVGDWSRTNKFVPLGIDEKGYIPVQTQVGQLLVSVDSVNSYLDGYKVDLEIGNPQSVTFNGVAVSLNWSPTLSPSVLTNQTAMTTWRNAQKNKTEQISNQLLPGYWNNVEIIVTPATTEEIRNLQISIQTASLILGTRNVKP